MRITAGAGAVTGPHEQAGTLCAMFAGAMGDIAPVSCGS